MLTHHTLTRGRALRLDGMANAFEAQLAQPAVQALTFDERFGFLVDHEHAWRDSKRIKRLLKNAKLKFSAACIEDIDYRASRALDKRLVATLASCDWLRQAQHVILCGATGVGKTWLACAFGNLACRQGFSVFYTRLSRLFEQLRIAHGDGSFTRKLAQLAKLDLLILDDWAIAPMSQPERNDLLEVLDDRVGSRSTLITSQLPVQTWYEYVNDPTLADAILDRIFHLSHKIALKGDSLRKQDTEHALNAFPTVLIPLASSLARAPR